MRTILVVILDEFCQHGPNMLLVQDDDVVKALAAQRADDALHDSIISCLQLHAAAAIPCNAPVPSAMCVNTSWLGSPTPGANTVFSSVSRDKPRTQEALRALR
jgi:hypothetical protein